MVSINAPSNRFSVPFHIPARNYFAKTTAITLRTMELITLSLAFSSRGVEMVVDGTDTDARLA
jgi:hypothetical protein